MDKFSPSQIAAGITPAHQSSAIDAAGVPTAHPYPDLIIVSLAEDYGFEHLPLREQAKHAGLSFESIVVGQDDVSDLPRKIEALHTQAKLGPGTQVIVKMHGEVKDGRHWLGTSGRNLIDTGELINMLRCPPGSSKAASQWKGVVHLISCHIAAAGELMRDRLGYCVLYGGHEDTLSADGIETVKEMMRVFGLSKKQDGSAINATAMFPFLSSFSGEPVTLAGNGRCEFIHPFDAPAPALLTEQSETERWMRILLSRLDHGTSAEVRQILDVMGPQLANTMHTGSRPMHIAASSRVESTEKIDALLRAGANINATDQDGSSALMEACKYGRSKTVEYLLEKGADPEIINARGEKVIDFAIQLGRRHILLYLVSAGADINQHGARRVSPFLNACMQKNADLVETMLTIAHPDLSVCTPLGETALHIACEAFEPELVERMLEHDGDPLAPDVKGVTPMERALERGDRAILHALFGHFFETVAEEDITDFLALAQKAGARSVVEKLKKTLGE